MNTFDQKKVLKAGFIIIRERDVGLKHRKYIVSCKTRDFPEWHNCHTGFKSKAARRRFMNDFLRDNTVVED